MKKSTIGLPQTYCKDASEELNVLLSSFQVYYQNLRGIHWNIKGKNFFELHVKFEELYTDAQLKIDQIAERILTLHQTPLHTFAEYEKQSKVSVAKNITEDKPSIDMILASLSEIIAIERKILAFSGENDDEGTNSMMSDFISEQEKTVWMFTAWLGS